MYRKGVYYGFAILSDSLNVHQPGRALNPFGFL